MAWHERLQTGFDFGYDGYGRKLAAHEPLSLCESLTGFADLAGHPNISLLPNIGKSAKLKEAVGAPEMAPTAFVFPQPAPAHATPRRITSPIHNRRFVK